MKSIKEGIDPITGKKLTTMQSTNWLFTLLLLSGKLIKGGKVVNFKGTLTSSNIIRKYQDKLINKNSAKVNSVKKTSGAGKVFKPEKLVLENGEIAFKSNNGVLVRSADYLDEFGNIKWPLHDGFVLDSAGKPIMKNVDLKTGQILDRYGNPSGTFTSPVENGKIPSYDTRGLPYPESAKTYHQYEFTQDINTKTVRKAYDNLPSSIRDELDDAMKNYGFSLDDIANPQKGTIAEVFGSGGGTQIELGTTVDWYEKLSLIKEIK